MESGLMAAWMGEMLRWLSLPEVGLGAVFAAALVSATLLPMGSEPVLVALVTYQPELLWPAIAVATAGNTLGGMLTWWMGRMARLASERIRHEQRGEATALRWLQQFGPKACLLAWLPVVGDPLCAVAGWMKFPPAPCFAYMAVGKLARYVSATYLFMMWM